MNTFVPSARARQRGVVLIFALIVLLILTIGGVALLRSMSSSLFAAGNLAFRRDLMNQGEQAVANVMVQFQTGALATSGVTDADLISANYKSTTLPTDLNAQGVPNSLLSDTVFTTVGQIANDITGATSDVKIRYVIYRLCNTTGVAISTNCVQSTAVPSGGTHNRNTAVAPPSATVYLLSVRVTGARSTQVFMQTTFTKPD